MPPHEPKYFMKNDLEKNVLRILRKLNRIKIKVNIFNVMCDK
jgi:hypothetical protein